MLPGTRAASSPRCCVTRWPALLHWVEGRATVIRQKPEQDRAPGMRTSCRCLLAAPVPARRGDPGATLMRPKQASSERGWMQHQPESAAANLQETHAPARPRSALRAKTKAEDHRYRRLQSPAQEVQVRPVHRARLGTRPPNPPDASAPSPWHAPCPRRLSRLLTARQLRRDPVVEGGTGDRALTAIGSWWCGRAQFLHHHLPHHELLRLARHRHRQRIDKPDMPWHLEVRDLAAAKVA